jgi:hypothetical protein
MPIFMDRHDQRGVKAEDVADAHRRDIEIQDRYGVKYMALVVRLLLRRPTSEGRICAPADRRHDPANPRKRGGHDIIYFAKREMNSRAYCGAFNVKGPDQQKKVGMLSGGERNRVHLAKMLNVENFSYCLRKAFLR